METSRHDVPQSLAACSRVFFKRDLLSEMMGLKSNTSVHCSSAAARGPANQSSCSSVAKLRSPPPLSGVAPRASSVAGTSHQ
jgi:hypothetical protein